MQFKSTLTYPNIHNIKMKNSIKPMKPVIINYQKNPQKPTNYIWNVKIDRYLSKSWCSFLHVGHWSNLETITRKLLQTPAQKKKKEFRTRSHAILNGTQKNWWGLAADMCLDVKHKSRNEPWKLKEAWKKNKPFCSETQLSSWFDSLLPQFRFLILLEMICLIA